MRLWAEQILLVNIYFSILGMAFAVPFLRYFPKAPVSCCKKKIELIFVAMYFYIFKILFSNWRN